MGVPVRVVTENGVKGGGVGVPVRVVTEKGVAGGRVGVPVRTPAVPVGILEGQFKASLCHFDRGKTINGSSQGRKVAKQDVGNCRRLQCGTASVTADSRVTFQRKMAMGESWWNSVIGDHNRSCFFGFCRICTGIGCMVIMKRMSRTLTEVGPTLRKDAVYGRAAQTCHWVKGVEDPLETREAGNHTNPIRNKTLSVEKKTGKSRPSIHSHTQADAA